jgi:N-acetylglucosaminyl-diphospho-decaprenol L-rhamnosyltransferase
MISPRIICSIVSHGQVELLAALLSDLEAIELHPEIKIVVTENTADDASLVLASQSLLAARGQLKTIQNDQRLGFGANHNQAFGRSAELFENYKPQVFVVLNPDLRIPLTARKVFNVIASSLISDPLIGVAAPEIVTSDGKLEDSARYTPTVGRIVRKLLFKDRGTFPRTTDASYEPDWIAGMFLAFSAECFSALNGFDERYFLYYEDADICLRARAAGYRIVVNPTQVVVHNAQRASHHDIKRAVTHITSMGRFLLRS